MKMEDRIGENLPVSEDRSLETFKQNVLDASDLGDSFSTISPDSSTACSDYDDDQFEGIFYNTVRDETCISVNFVSNAFFNSFLDKLLSDFSSSIECDETRRIYKCTTHIRSLKCDLKLDGNSKNVTVLGTGRILWRKDYFPKLARIIFKHYVQISESQLGQSLIESSQCDVLTAEKVEVKNGESANTVQVVFSSTPLIQRKDSQTASGENTIQPPVFNSTPIVPRLNTQTTGRRLDTQRTEMLDTANALPGSKSQVCSDQQSIVTDAPPTQVPVQTNFGDGRIINQPQFNAPGYSHTNTRHYTCTNTDDGLPASQPVYIPGFCQTNSDGMYFNGNEFNTPHTVLDRNGVLFTQGASLRTDRECMTTAPYVYEPQQFNTIGGEVPIQPAFAITNLTGPQTFSNGPNQIPQAYTIDTHVNNNGTDTVHPRPMLSGDPINNVQPTDASDVTARTFSTIIQKIKGLENQINNMKTSLIASMESKLDEMKSSLIRLIDNTASKTYSQAVQQSPISVDSSSIDEGYGNNTIENTSRDISQTLPKTVVSPKAAVDKENKRRSPS